MKLLNRLYLWSANRQLHSLSQEIAAARDYQEYLEGCYINAVVGRGDWDRGDLLCDIDYVREQVEFFEHERVLTLARIAGLKAKLNISS